MNNPYPNINNDQAFNSNIGFNMNNNEIQNPINNNQPYTNSNQPFYNYNPHIEAKNNNHIFDSQVNTIRNNDGAQMQPLPGNNIIVNVNIQSPQVSPYQVPVMQLGVDNSKIIPKEDKDDNHIKFNKKENAKARIEICHYFKNILLLIIILGILLSCTLIILGALLKSNASKIVGNLVIAFAVVCILLFIYGWISFYL